MLTVDIEDLTAFGNKHKYFTCLLFMHQKKKKEEEIL